MSAGRAALVLLCATAAGLLLPMASAQAHPLGNFTVNHYDGLTLRPDEVALLAVVDRAEIPTAQLLQTLGPDGVPGPDRLHAAAVDECADLAAAVGLEIDGIAVQWEPASSTLETRPGAAGLPTLRLTCRLAAEAELGRHAVLAFRDEYLADQVGWREVTARGNGVRLVDSPVPVASVSDELRSYPRDLLSSPVDVRSFSVPVEPGTGGGPGAAVRPTGGDPFSTALAGLDRRLEDLVGDRGLSPLAGTLALVLAVLLGCGHALLPGHGKTVMAAYLAGRHGRARDAVAVGATVTVTHTVGVFLLAVALSVSSSLAGDRVLGWLGMASGLLVAVIGATMVRAAVRGWRSRPGPALQEALVGGHEHPHGHHEHPHGHHEHVHGDHEHPQGDHEHPQGDHEHPQGDHEHAHGHSHGPMSGRGRLIGMGVAGGLVPSPSALILLLACIGLGRTAFGVVLVLAYGAGMALTLTAAGLALVRLADRAVRPRTARVQAVVPVLTASLVVVLGVALAARGLALSA